jgi:hypothetical protein
MEITIGLYQPTSLHIKASILPAMVAAETMTVIIESPAAWMM